MKAAVFEKPGVIAIRQVPVPEIGDDEVLIKVKYTGICGTDWSIYTGKAVGNTATYEQAFRMVRDGGTVSAFGITNEPDTMPLRTHDLVLHEKKVTGSCAGVGNDWPEAMTLMEHGRIVPRHMFSMIVPLEELEAALKEIRTNPDLIKVFVSSDISKREIL
jgi:threonine dehydrogenase-like Zn-dependent dehydrogenase